MSISNQPAPISQPLLADAERVPTHRSYRRNLLLDVPIAGRLALGFILAALIAGVAAGVIGFQRSQSLTRQSDFYQTLLQTNTSLTTGANFLQLMNIEANKTLQDASVNAPSQETLTQDQGALQGLLVRYDSTLADYTAHQLLNQHTDRVALLAEANHANQVDQQRTLVGSVLRTWKVHRVTQLRILQDISTGKLVEAQYLARYQGEPTNADAQSALRALIQFDGRLAVSIRDAANVEQQNQFIATGIAVLLACLFIGLVGWLISNTLIQRLQLLRRVSRLVEKGQLDSRVTVIGRDEIADVSLSINSMLDTIVGLLSETRRHRDALTNAAQHLFSYMQVVSASEFRANTTTNDDPISMLTDAFNFTVGRFRRFSLRTQTSAEQLEVLSRQEMEQAEMFTQVLRTYTTGLPDTEALSKAPSRRLQMSATAARNTREDAVQEHVNQAHERLMEVGRNVIKTHTMTILGLTNQTTFALARLRQQIAPTLSLLTNQAKQPTRQLQELQSVEGLLQQLSIEIRIMQSETIRSLSEADKMLVQSLSLLKTPNKESLQPMVVATTNDVQELKRSSLQFVQEITNQAKLISAIAQEIRANNTAFKVAAGEKSTTVSEPQMARRVTSRPLTRA